MAHAEGPSFLTLIHQSTIQDPGFNKTYFKSGCFVRAHWIANLIQKSGHVPLKVFIETTAPNEKMQIQLPSGQQTNWVFHVAAGVKDSSGQIWIVDPILASEVLSLKQWTATIENQNPGLRLEMHVTGPEIYHVDANENAEFLLFGKPFSEKAMEFIRDGMEDLFTWDQATGNPRD